MKKVCIYPQIKEDNLYVRNFANTISSNYEIVEFTNIIKRPYLFFSIDAIHFNWFENVNSKSTIKKYAEYTSKRFILFLCCITRKKIVWTLHNKKNHTNDKTVRKMSDKLMQLLAIKSKKICVHCSEGLNYIKNYYGDLVSEKCILIPHGDFIGNYKESSRDLRKELEIKPNELVFMFVGQIRPYKNIEILVESFLESDMLQNSILVVAGSSNDEYKMELLEKYGSIPNILFRFGFIANDDMTCYIKCADIFVTPYELESSLNSGSIIMYFSYGKTVISSNVGTLKNIPSDLYYGYDYQGQDNHKSQLMKKISQAYYEFLNDNSVFKRKGREAYKFIDSNYRWIDLRPKLLELYK